MSTTGPAMRRRLTRGQGRSVGRGSVSLMPVPLRRRGRCRRRRPRPGERERVRAEERLADRWRLEHVPGRAAGEHRAAVHGDEAVGQLGNERDVVLDDEHGRTQAVAHGAQQLHHGLHFALGHARGGLVEEDDRRLVGHHRRQVDQPPGARRELAHQAVGVALEPEHVHQRGDPRRDRRLRPHLDREAEDGVERVAHVGEALERHGQGIAHGQPREEARVLEGAPQPEPGAGRGRALGHVEAAQLDVTGVGPQEARDHVEERRLAGAVGPDDPDDLPVGRVQGHVVERGIAPEGERDAAHVEVVAPRPDAGGRAGRPGRATPRPSGRRSTRGARGVPPARRPNRRTAPSRSP